MGHEKVRVVVQVQVVLKGPGKAHGVIEGRRVLDLDVRL
jgi:hypothetical protein